MPETPRTSDAKAQGAIHRAQGGRGLDCCKPSVAARLESIHGSLSFVHFSPLGTGGDVTTSLYFFLKRE
jgi:hypothetical protein